MGIVKLASVLKQSRIDIVTFNSFASDTHGHLICCLRDVEQLPITEFFLCEVSEHWMF